VTGNGGVFFRTHDGIIWVGTVTDGSVQLAFSDDGDTWTPVTVESGLEDVSVSRHTVVVDGRLYIAGVAPDSDGWSMWSTVDRREWLATG
jgi:hypothetical protein